jgi:protein tyrosine phosphatase
MPARPPPSAATLHALLSPREKARRLQLQESTGPSAYSALAARDPANKRKNRYSDVVPYDRTRVKVADVDGPDGYLNASWIEELDGQRRWIAAQVR